METCSLAYNGNVSRAAFHNLTSYCNNSDDVSGVLIFPSTFFIQLVRFSLSICAILLLSTLYNTITVMNRQILSTATCSVFWVLMCSMLTLKSVVLMVFPVVPWKVNVTGPQDGAGPPVIMGDFSMAGFILQALLQSVAVLMLFTALDHERCFRSSDYATVDLPARHCVALSYRFKQLCSWPHMVALVLTATPLLLLVAIELVYHFYHHDPERVPAPLLWVYIASLPLTRLACVVLGVVLVLMRQDKLAPTIPAKTYLMFGLALSLVEDFPNFVTGCNHMSCLLEVLTLFDLTQLIGIGSLVFFVLFVRSQYLRVEQESKLNLVCELQKLLQVNGRKDIITHYT